jgi:hypothetical protein
MRVLSQSRFVLPFAALLSCLAWGGPVLAADKDKEENVKRVSIPTADGVDLQGSFYPPGGGKPKDASVLLLHNFEMHKGGSSHQDGWDALAERLQKEGYAVLSFDFRGFGASKSIDAAKFWKMPYNMGLRGARLNPQPETIDEKEFPPQYYPYLINDIAAARAYLDRRSDAGDGNSSNLIVIGAGEGATLGAMWMALECRRQRDITPKNPIGIPIGPPQFDDPEGKDLMCGVWLSMSTTLAGQRMPLTSVLTDVARLGKVPQIFIYGKNDTPGTNFATAMEKAIKGSQAPKNIVAVHPVLRTDLRGSKLLNEKLDTENWIAQKCLPGVLDLRTARESRKHDGKNDAYVLTFPWPGKTGVRPVQMQVKPPKLELPLYEGRAFAALGLGR